MTWRDVAGSRWRWTADQTEAGWWSGVRRSRSHGCLAAHEERRSPHQVPSTEHQTQRKRTVPHPHGYVAFQRCWGICAPKWRLVVQTWQVANHKSHRARHNIQPYRCWPPPRSFPLNSSNLVSHCYYCDFLRLSNIAVWKHAKLSAVWLLKSNRNVEKQLDTF